MPDRPSRREASTSCVLLPIEDTIPMPVTTTRFISASLIPSGLSVRPWRRPSSAKISRRPARSRPGTGRPSGPWRRVDGLAIGLQPAVADAEHQLRLAGRASGRRHIRRSSPSAAPCRRTSPRRPRGRAPCPAAPSQPRKKPSICHSASRPRQPGITGSPLKWHRKNQRSGLTSSSARTSPLPCSPPVLGDLGDPVEHQHRRQRQLRVALAEQFAAPAGEQVLVVEAR